jgi:hypothetical protein
MASGLISNQRCCTLHTGITFKCVGPSMGEKQPLTKKLPSTTTVSTCYHFYPYLLAPFGASRCYLQRLQIFLPVRLLVLLLRWLGLLIGTKHLVAIDVCFYCLHKLVTRCCSSTVTHPPNRWSLCVTGWKAEIFVRELLQAEGHQTETVSRGRGTQHILNLHCSLHDQTSGVLLLMYKRRIKKNNTA